MHGSIQDAWAAFLNFEYWPEIGAGTLDTLVMTGFSLLFTVLIGLPIGTVLFLTSWRQRSERDLWRNGVCFQRGSPR